ncbi:XRE family transcriptional regulator [Rhizobium leguminosarum]|uniref:XRE family transcriptional regulator n=1 Tax=Rhizobium leguminosarum TaxID=384 RepID=UPI00182DFF83|nr:XRE family transcriptional regulator [Rhizobium leguminosarum]MBB4344438.1 gamma-glutamylcysteine synthetase [Rhizobium leguminosarum]MBB6297510.1 gamma-glutamylcysteine synthetase [Rhizobium leguminosarum]
MLSQRDAAEGAKVMQKSVSAAETSKSTLLETNLSLVDFYTSKGILLLGEGMVGEEVVRSGARWVAPEAPGGGSALSTFHGEETGVSFRAARALLNKKQAQVAEAANLTLDVVKGLETETRAREPHRTLKEWYEQQGVEFTGFGDVSSGKFYGVGVRWKPARP